MGRRPDRSKVLEPLPLSFMARLLDAFGASPLKEMSHADTAAFGIAAMSGVLLRLARLDERAATETWEAIWAARRHFPDRVSRKGPDAAVQESIGEIASYRSGGRPLKFELQLLLEDGLLAEELEALGGDRGRIKAWLVRQGLTAEDVESFAGDSPAMIIREILRRRHSLGPSTQEKLLAKASKRVRALRGSSRSPR